MKKTKFLSFLLTITIMLTALAFPASADGAAPTLIVTNPGTTAQTLSLCGLPEECYGIQFTLELDQKLDNVAFVFADSLPAASAYYTYREGVPGELNVTLYLTTKAAFTPGELVLGTLSSNQAFQIEAVSDLTLLLGRDLEPVSYKTVTLENASGSGSGSSGVTRYTIKIPDLEHGSITVSRTSAAAGSEITVTVLPDEGYCLAELTVTTRSGTKIEVTDKGEGVFTFVMPSATVELNASFTEAPEEVPEPVVLPFTDVPEDEWYYDAVAYVYTHKLMIGNTDVLFSPDETTSRAMIVTILHRLEGEPDAGASAFDDVEPGQWYENAVNWAAANGIVMGYSDEIFAPDDSITREQMAAILYRYAKYKGYDVTAQADLSTFADMEEVSPYAVEAMQWAAAKELILGTPGETGMMLDPSGGAVRCQSAAILMRFCENITE